MAASRYQRLAYRLFGHALFAPARRDNAFATSLKRAHIDVLPEVYLSQCVLHALLAFATGTGFLVLIFAFGQARLVRPGPGATLIPFVVPFVTALAVFTLAYYLPRIKAANRARDIDAKLPYALNYIATMSSAGITPQRIFAGLASQRLYGEVAEEASWIERDMRILGLDVLTALRAATERTPSQKFQDVLRGAIAAVGGGGQLRDYFAAKAEQFLYEGHQDQKRFLETLSILAESFITVVVAGPLIVIILFSVLSSFGGGGPAPLSTGYLLVLLVVPLAQLGFAATVKLISPEV